MNLGEMKEIFERFPKDKVLKYGISEPFSWRGSYYEVAFDVDKFVTVEECLERVEQALTRTFTGYKGGEFKYYEGTTVHFEEDNGSYTDGDYREDMIAEILDEKPEHDRDKHLVELMCGG